MKVKVISLIALFIGTMGFAQEDLAEREKQAAFDPAYSSYSRKKPAYVTLKDGTKWEGEIKGVGYREGQIDELKLVVDGKKKKFAASEIQDLFMAPSGMEKLGQMSSFWNDATKWGRSDASEYFAKGYTMHTNETVSLKNKKKPEEYLMQTVNPRYSQIIQVFSDPWARETASIGVGSLKLAGGIAKSYYVKKDDSIVWLTKKNFDEHFDRLFNDNAQFKAKYTDQKIKWSLLGVYVLDYTEFSLSDQGEAK